MKCEKCGADIPPGKNFCTKCGARIERREIGVADESLPSLRPTDPRERRMPPPAGAPQQYAPLGGYQPMGLHEQQFTPPPPQPAPPAGSPVTPYAGYQPMGTQDHSYGQSADVPPAPPPGPPVAPFAGYQPMGTQDNSYGQSAVPPETPPGAPPQAPFAGYKPLGMPDQKFELPSLGGAGPMVDSMDDAALRQSWAPGPPPGYPPPAPGAQQPAQQPPGAHHRSPGFQAQQQFVQPDQIQPIPGVDDELINDLLLKEDKNRAKERMIYRRPFFWFLVGAAVMAPGLFLPWVRLFNGYAAGPFRLPLVFLLTGEKAAVPFLSAGLLLAAAIGASVALSLKKRRIVTYLRVAAVGAMLLSVLAVLFSLRSWSLSHSDAANYPAYEKRQTETLNRVFTKTDGFFGKKAPKTVAQKKPPAKGPAFIRKVVRPGAWFPLIGGLIIFVTSIVFASTQRTLHYTLPSTAAAVVIVFGAIALGLVLIHLLMPARWYQLNATMYGSVGMRKPQEKALKKCASLDLPLMSCEMNLAQLYMDTRREDEALKMYEDISKRNPKYVQANKFIGLINFRKREYDKAAENFKKFRTRFKADADVNKKYSDTLRAMAEREYDKGNIDRTVELYKEAYEVLPALKKDVGADMQMGALLNEKKDYKGSAEYMKMAADLDAKSYESQMKAAAALELAESFQDSIAYYERCIEIKEDELPCYGGIAHVQFEHLDQPAKAIETIDTGLAVMGVGDDARNLLELKRKIER